MAIREEQDTLAGAIQAIKIATQVAIDKSDILMNTEGTHGAGTDVSLDSTDARPPVPIDAPTCGAVTINALTCDSAAIDTLACDPFTIDTPPSGPVIMDTLTSDPVSKWITGTHVTIQIQTIAVGVTAAPRAPDVPTAPLVGTPTEPDIACNPMSAFRNDRGGAAISDMVGDRRLLTERINGPDKNIGLECDNGMYSPIRRAGTSASFGAGPVGHSIALLRELGTECVSDGGIHYDLGQSPEITSTCCDDLPCQIYICCQGGVRVLYIDSGGTLMTNKNITTFVGQVLEGSLDSSLGVGRRIMPGSH